MICKSRLGVDGPQQELGCDCCETYTLVLSWSPIHLFLNFSSAPKFHDKDHFVQLKKSLYGSNRLPGICSSTLQKGVHPIKDLPLLITSPHHSNLMFVYTDDHLVFTCNELYLWLRRSSFPCITFPWKYIKMASYPHPLKIMFLPQKIQH